MSGVSIFNELSTRDLQQRYSSSVVAIKEGDRLSPFYIEVIKENLKKDPETDKVYVEKYISGSKVYKSAWEGCTYTFEEILNNDILDLSYPDLGCINVKDSVVYVSRKAERQWSRGLRQGTMILQYPTNYLFDTFIGSVHYDPLEISLLDALYNKEYYSVTSGIEELLVGNKLAVAINSKFFFSVNPSKESLCIGYKNNIVGELDTTTMKGKLLPFASHIKEELSEYILIEEF